MRVDLTPFLAEHPDGAAHLEHGTETVDHAGVPSSGQGRRWNYAAPWMRAWCGCGWRGPTHPQRPIAKAAGGARRGEWERVNRPALRAIGDQWSDHVHAVLPTLRVLEVMAELRDVERALTAAVIDARNGGASWADVAAAAGIRRQSAHERWRHHDPLLPTERSRGGRPRKSGTSTRDTASTSAAVGDSATTGKPVPAPGPASASDVAHVTARLVRRLSVELAGRVDRHVEASWQGTRSRDGRRGGWVLQWAAGPTRAEMRQAAAAAVAEVPGLAELDLSALSWWRTEGSAVDEAAATLAWIEAHPDEVSRVRHLPSDELPGWPERLPARTRARAETLVAAGWAAQTAGPAADELTRHATAGGAAAVAAWLDELAAVQDAAVVDLDARRHH